MKKNKYLTKILATTGTLVVAGGTVATVLTLKNNKDKDSPPDEHLLGDDNYVVTDEQITQFFQDSREQLAANIVWLYSQPGPQHMEDDLIKSTVKQATGLYTKKFNDYQKQLEQEKQDKDFKEESDEPIIDDNSKKLSYLRSINDVVGVNPVDWVHKKNNTKSDVEIFKQDLIVGQGMSEQEATNKANDIQQQLLGTEDLARSFRLSDTNFSFYYLSSTSLDGINTTSSLNSSPLSNLSLSNQIQSLHNAQIAKIVSSNEIREEILKTSPDVNGFKIPERLRQLGVTSQTIENQKNVALQMAQGAIGRTLVANDQFDFASLLKAYGNTTDTQFIYDQTNNLLHPDHVSETLNYSYSKTYGASLDIDLSAYDYQSEATTDADFDSNAILTETKSFDTYNVAGGVSTLGQNEIMPQYQVRMRILKLDTQTNAQSVKVTFQIGISSSYEGNDDDKILWSNFDTSGGAADQLGIENDENSGLITETFQINDVEEMKFYANNSSVFDDVGSTIDLSESVIGEPITSKYDNGANEYDKLLFGVGDTFGASAKQRLLEKALVSVPINSTGHYILPCSITDDAVLEGIPKPTVAMGDTRMTNTSLKFVITDIYDSFINPNDNTEDKEGKYLAIRGHWAYRNNTSAAYVEDEQNGVANINTDQDLVPISWKHNEKVYSDAWFQYTVSEEDKQTLLQGTSNAVLYGGVFKTTINAIDGVPSVQGGASIKWTDDTADSMKNCLDTREAASSLRIISAALAEAQSIVELALAIVTGGGTVFTGIALAVWSTANLVVTSFELDTVIGQKKSFGFLYDTIKNINEKDFREAYNYLLEENQTNFDNILDSEYNLPGKITACTDVNASLQKTFKTTSGTEKKLGEYFTDVVSNVQEWGQYTFDISDKDLLTADQINKALDGDTKGGDVVEKVFGIGKWLGTFIENVFDMITTFAVTKVLTGVFEKYLNSAGRVIDDGWKQANLQSKNIFTNSLKYAEECAQINTKIGDLSKVLAITAPYILVFSTVCDLITAILDVIVASWNISS